MPRLVALCAPFVTVNWTIATPDDDTIHSKTKRRRHRLLRLLQEAEQQAAAPTYKQLADVLEVSERTISRDMKALRKSHSELPRTSPSPNVGRGPG